MLPLPQTLKEKVNTLPKGGVFLCYAQENTRQRKILERVGETFRQHGHVVMNLMCNTMLCSRIDETIEVQWLTPHEEVEKYDHGVCQYLAYQAVLIMP
jgi:hypothetical protein